jgi:hypothetical protein
MGTGCGEEPEFIGISIFADRSKSFHMMAKRLEKRISLEPC